MQSTEQLEAAGGGVRKHLPIVTPNWKRIPGLFDPRSTSSYVRQV